VLLCFVYFASLLYYDPMAYECTLNFHSFIWVTVYKIVKVRVKQSHSTYLDAGKEKGFF
jgi:hypothetical protein